MNKKIVKLFTALSLLATLMLMLTSCEPAATPTTTTTTTTTVSTPTTTEALEEGMVDTSQYKKDGKFVIGISYQGETNDWASSLVHHLNYALEIKYADVIDEVYWALADADANQQINTTEDLLTKDIDLLMIQPMSDSALVQTVEKAMGKNIPVVVFGSGIKTENYVSYINSDTYEMGIDRAQWMCDRLNGEGNIVCIYGFPGSGYVSDYVRAVDEILAKYPKINVLSTIYGNFSATKTKQQMETIINSYEDIDGVLVQGSLMGLGVYEAFVEAGLDVPPMTLDDWNAWQKKILGTDYTDYIAHSNGTHLGAVAVDTAIDILQGKPVQKVNMMKQEMFTHDELFEHFIEGMPDSYYLINSIPEEYIKQYWK